MKQDRKTARMTQIEEAAYDLMDEKGFAGASMLSIAKRAKASNETMYSWYGDKLGLFRSMVSHNAAAIRDTLNTSLEKQRDPMETLEETGVLLLTMLTGDRATALNRAAASDPSGVLGKALAQTGRDTVVPLIAQTLERARSAGALAFDDTAESTELFLGLLIGDLQIRGITGQVPVPGKAEVTRRAQRAMLLLRQLNSA